ncbi:MYG1 family protein [Microscilla marina]|uniref:Metal-dependent protein hydrolase n=1 Tax=Microscilla marina ATCC 23134 TaxID=313606 RepID=A1ZHW8_MICM2|nr:MYG1 family protein [Microscilla marina]EAY30125.1 metal-dependent protein hydrolase [Microscilla marina ATCC 23134]
MTTIPDQLITHNGSFHADEVFAVAILQKLKGAPLHITRTRHPDLLGKVVKNSNVLVVDVGLVYDPAHNNFDHHQDRHLKSAAGLVWEHFGSQLCGNNVDVALLVQESLIDLVDQTDTNQNNILKTIDEHLPGGTAGTVSGLIGAFNREPDNDDKQMEQFDKAVKMAATFLENTLYEAEKIVAQKPIWEARQMLTPQVVRLEQHCKGWKRWAALEPGIRFCLIPRASKNELIEGQQWQLTTIDAEAHPLPTLETMQAEVSNANDIEFAHKARFLAVFNNEATALEVVKLL